MGEFSKDMHDRIGAPMIACSSLWTLGTEGIKIEWQRREGVKGSPGRKIRGDFG